MGEPDEDAIRIVPVDSLDKAARSDSLRDYQRLAALSLELAQARDLDAVFRALRGFVQGQTPMSGLFVSEYDPHARLRTCVYAHSEGEDLDVRTFPKMAQTGSPHSQAVETGEVIVTDDFQAAMMGKPRVNVGLERDERLPESSIVVPMRVHDRILGAIEIQSTRSGVFTPQHVIVLRMAAHLVALAIQNVRAHEARERAKEALAQKAAQLEAEVQERTRELAAKNRELESFSWTVAHDLRAPLRGISSLAEALEQDHAGKLDDEARRHLEAMTRTIRRMSRLIDSLLEFARAAQGGVGRKLVDLTRLANEIQQELRAREPGRSARIVVQENLVAECDETLVRILLDNLIANAWKYSAKKPETTIEVGMRIMEGERVFFVRDEGAGFDPAQGKRLFGAFQRLHSPSDYEGTGIGLATARRIVERHAGRIWAEGDPGRGATFYFTLQPTQAA